jgi:hypothetical protein
MFWRFSVGPDYVEERVNKELIALFGAYEIESYVIYEMLGEFDLLIRFWLPTSVSPEDLDASVDESLRRVGLWSHQYLAVRKVVRHWAWSADVAPTDAAIATVTAAQVSELADYNRDVMVAYEAAKLADPLETSLPTNYSDPPAWIWTAEQLNLVRPVALGKKGIRFFLHFDFPQRPFRSQDDFAVISEAIDTACETAVRNSRISDDVGGLVDQGKVSLYAGIGGNWTNFLVVAQAPENEFYLFARDLVFGIRDSRAVHNFHIRPYTHVAADRTFRRFADNPAVQRSTDPIANLLTGPETTRFELKGTLSVNVDKLLSGGGRGIDPGREHDVVKAVCGLLNRSTTGRLVIGALESGRYATRYEGLLAAGAALAILEDNGSWRMLEDVGSFPEAQIVPLLGVEFEIRNGASFRSVDKFVLHLSNLLSSWIAPNPLGNLVIETESILDRTLTNILTTPGGTRWFYARKEKGGEYSAFYVREAAGTREYTGPDADNFRNISPRGGP